MGGSDGGREGWREISYRANRGCISSVPCGRIQPVIIQVTWKSYEQKEILSHIKKVMQCKVHGIYMQFTIHVSYLNLTDQILKIYMNAPILYIYVHI